ncbi:MAG: DUF5926 family protein [Actinomycetales bacterium]
MGKQARRRAAVSTSAGSDAAGAAVLDGIAPAGAGSVGGREPCPCGSGRRYKACHGREAARAAAQVARRPFEGIRGEADLVAMREILPAASARLTLRPELAEAHPDREVYAVSVLPAAWPAMARQDGRVFIALQVNGGSGDTSRDLAAALERALVAEPGNPLPPAGLTGPGPRLQDLLDLGAELQVQVHQGFDFWVEGIDADAEVLATVERANAGLVPTQRLTSVEAAYWCDFGDRPQLRWVLAEPDEERLLDAFARLHAAGEDSLVEGSRFLGSFRAYGLLVPVWELPLGTTPEQLEEPAAGYQSRLEAALSSAEPLSEAERGARKGLANRQITLS